MFIELMYVLCMTAVFQSPGPCTLYFTVACKTAIKILLTVKLDFAGAAVSGKQKMEGGLRRLGTQSSGNFLFVSLFGFAQQKNGKCYGFVITAF